MAASEATPLVKSGGLADVIGSLPMALVRRGFDVRVVMPKYEDLDASWVDRLQFLTSFIVQVGWRRQHCGVFSLKHEGVTYYLIDNEWYFRRRGLYGYGDDAERFVYFCEATAEMLAHIDWVPDVVHAHDWHAALLPVFLKTHYAQRPTRTVFTIHNIRYQGVFDRSVMHDLLNLGPEHDHSGALEYYGATNFMKGGIVYSDIVSTVSPTYAEEIRTQSYGEGLHGVLASRNVWGMINGIDTTEYNILTDRFLGEETNDVRARKRAMKQQLQQTGQLDIDPDVPLIAMVTRLVAQKGVDLVLHAFDALMQRDVQFVLLGAGDAQYEHAFRSVCGRYPGRAAAHIAFDERLSRWMYAGADALLMPSQFEPCGIGQLIAMRYGTVPIVRATGGLKDTVLPFDETTGYGHGFTFVLYYAHHMLDAIDRTLGSYAHKPTWDRIVSNALYQDWSWDASADAYAAMYEELLKA
jgi:starch synthase